MAPPKPDTISAIEKWLSQNSAKIEKFWLYTKWGMWARLELYLALEAALSKSNDVNQGRMLCDQKSIEEEADITIEPNDSNKQVTVIKLRCERVDENEGSFEAWAEQVDQDMARIKKLKDEQIEYPGAKLLFVGFSGFQPEATEEPFKTKPPPKLITSSGNVHLWVLEYKLPGKA